MNTARRLFPLVSSGVVALALAHAAAASGPSQPPVPSADTARLSLGAAVAEALQQRPLLTADTERVAAARARITQARAALLPRIDLQASATDGPLGAPALGLGGLVGTPIKKHTGGSLNFVQTLLDFGRAHNTIQAREAERAAGEEALNGDRNRVALEVQQAYLQVLQGQRLLAVNRQILEQRQLVVRQAATLLQNGLASRVDVDLAEVSVSQAQLASTRAQNDVEIGFAALGTALGRIVPSSTVLEDVLAAGPAGPEVSPNPASAPLLALPSAEEAVAAAVRDRPELRQSAAQVRVFEHLTAAARAAQRPLLTGVGSVGKINPVPLFAASDKPWAVGVALTIPVFTGRLVEGQVEEARRNANASRAASVELANTVRQQVIGALANLSASEESLRTTQAQLVRAQDALSLATQRYQAQLGSIVELSQAQVAYATAQNDFVRALYDRELARAALNYAIGRGYTPAGRKSS